MNKSELQRKGAYGIFSVVVLVILAFLFMFPLYWIVTGAFKIAKEYNSVTPVWFPTVFTLDNFARLFARRTAPLWELAVPFSAMFTPDKTTIILSGPQFPAAIRWLLNTVFMAVMAMVLTCITASMAGYALAKKRFPGRALLFSLIVCAMALPKQVILIPLIKEISAIGLWDNIWAVIFPTVGWPFGVFLMKQFSEGIPGEILEAARIDGGGELKTFTTIVFPMIKPGVGALAIFTFINTWNDYFMQLLMLTGTNVLSMPLGISKMMGEFGQDYGLLMAGATLASVPIIIVFLAFQKYFTKGITMGAVKG